MKRLLIQIAFLCVFMIGNCQNSKKYLVFTFNCKYKVENYIHGTADNLWIVPYDSCLNGLNEKDMNPLFVTEDDKYDLANKPENAMGYYFITESDYASNPESMALLKNRKRIQERVTKFSITESKELLTIDVVPIKANCSTHKFGFYDSVVTIDSDFEIWDDFWNIGKKKLRMILNHDFSRFDYRICPSYSQKVMSEIHN